MKKKFHKKIKAMIVILSLLTSFYANEKAYAGDLTNEKDTMTRLVAGGLSSHDINFLLRNFNIVRANEVSRELLDSDYCPHSKNKLN